MTPAAATARTSSPLRRAAGPARPALSPVAPKPSAQRRAATAPSARPRRGVHPVGVAVGLVVASLLAVVVGNMVLASGQLNLQHVQGQLSVEEASYATQLASVTAAESPATVAQSALGLHLVQPSEILQLASVPLMRRLGPPVFSSAPCCSLTPGR